MFIALGAALVEAAADAGADVVAVEELVLLEVLLQAASARAATATAVTAALRPRDRVAGKEGTAKLLCARSLGGGLADWPVGRVPARLTGFLTVSARGRSPRLGGTWRRRRHEDLHSASARVPAREIYVTD